MAPALAAGAFASVMAFQTGGIVPGVELGDVVNARVEPGETIIPKQMTERLNRAADDTDSRSGAVNLFHYRPTFHLNALDTDGVDKVLTKHASTFQKHVTRAIGRMNK